jgi:nitrogenase molybdenum-cofactor synthesis protein NifE
VLRMKQTARIISVYTADVSGVASALFELGGMTVMHDASGCNSTYNTHDEPRWYDHDSLVFISALTEMEAIMGDDEKLIRDVTDAALELRPRFIAIAGTPIPMMIGTDFQAVAARVEKNTGIPCFGLKTNSMHSYLSGASMAFEALAKRMCYRTLAREKGSGLVNVLGMTPLDFSVNGSDGSIRAWLEENGFAANSVWAMGGTLDELMDAGRADVNLVVSWDGLAAAKYLRQTFGTPYVVGVPIGADFAASLAETLGRAADADEDIVGFEPRPGSWAPEMTIIGESVYSGSLSSALWLQEGVSARVICPLETEDEFLSPGDAAAMDEDELLPLLNGAGIVVADPMYQPVCPAGTDFRALPSEAFSGRIYRRDIPNLINKTIDVEKMS